MNCPTCSAQNPPQSTACHACHAPLHAQNPAAIAGAAEPYSPALASGTRLRDGAFALGEVLGQGGFGITYRGGDLSLRRYVAIKEFFPHGCHRQGTSVVPGPPLDAASFEAARKGFVLEAMTLARFNHAGIVRVFGVFEENSTAYMVMELLEGQSLQKRLDDRGVVPEKEAVGIIAQVGAALEAVHASKTLHRDIKPDNIVLTNDGRVVLIDFGTAREFVADKTRAMTALVTHGYAPLEQYTRQAKFGPFTDVYALGATLYHCLCGEVPASAMERVAGAELAPPERVNPNLSRKASQATMRALELKPGDRFQSVAEFIAALDAPAKSPAVPSPSPTPTSVLPLPASASAPTPLAATRLWTPGAPDSNADAPAAAAATLTGAPCVHCGAAMSDKMTRCPRCLQPVVQQIDSPDVLLAPERADGLFDRVMFAVPNWMWRTLAVMLALGATARLGLGVARYQNGGRDFGPELAGRVMKQPSASELSTATLQRGEGVYDRDSMRVTHDDYVGEVRYRDGDVGTLQLDVTGRDWLYSPEKFRFSFAPRDFGELIGGQIQAATNQELHQTDAALSMTSISLKRQARADYKGRYVIERKGRLGYQSGGDVSAKVLTFNTDGSPATWSHSISPE